MHFTQPTQTSIDFVSMPKVMARFGRTAEQVYKPTFRARQIFAF